MGRLEEELKIHKALQRHARGYIEAVRWLQEDPGNVQLHGMANRAAHSLRDAVEKYLGKGP